MHMEMCMWACSLYGLQQACTGWCLRYGSRHTTVCMLGGVRTLLQSIRTNLLSMVLTLGTFS
jgi:hypothetical protein